MGPDREAAGQGSGGAGVFAEGAGRDQRHGREVQARSPDTSKVSEQGIP